ncbi:hypothetical protein LUZ60_000548 [Juncus effusus]|nr:hypothetical protein LUZ60_000548 [Juncus effusus]
MESFEPISSIKPIPSIKPIQTNRTRPIISINLPDRCLNHFQMPLHYPRYTREEYNNMPEWKLDCLLVQYGLPVSGGVEEKRRFAIGAFCWTTPTVVKEQRLIRELHTC